MRKAVLALTVALLLSLFVGCAPADDPVEDAALAEYAAIYERDTVEPYPEIEALADQKAAYGYTLKAQQGYNGWYYLSDGTELTYSAQNDFWGTSTAYISGAEQYSDGTSAVSKVYRVKSGGSGKAVVAGQVSNLSANEDAEFSIELNGTQIYPETDVLTIPRGDSIGFWFELRVDLYEGDTISFTCRKGKLSVNPTISYDYAEGKIHFDLTGSYDNGLEVHIGDVHPYWHDGKLYMYYLCTDGTYTSKLMTSEDMINYTAEEIFRVEPYTAYSTYYVLGVMPYKDKYVSFAGGAQNVISANISPDLIHWSRLDQGTDSKELPRSSYPLGLGDPYAFYDSDVGKYRVIYHAAYAKEEGVDVDWALALQTSNSDDLSDGWQGTEIELLRFDNYGASKRERPECPQMLKLGDRWYVIASMYSRSVHGVGRLSYWKGEAGKTIDETDWQDAYEQFIDGEDICAAQIVEIEGKYYMFGWVPQLADGGTWGGALSLAREVYQLPNGDLATRLDPYMAKLLNKGKLYHAEESISLSGTEEAYQFNNYAQIDIPGIYGRSIVDCALDLSQGSKAGILLTDPATPDTHFIYVDKTMSMLYVMVKQGTNYKVRAQIALQVDDWSDVEVKVLIDGNIVDVFVNDMHSLAARLSSSYELTETTISLFASGNASFREVTVSKLSPAQMLTD